MIRFKQPVLNDELKTLWVKNQVLFEIVNEISAFAEIIIGQDTTITSIFRPKDKGVHGLWRGVDIRTHNFSEEEIEIILTYINSRWVYDAKRRNFAVLIYHDVGQGDHFHIQTHASTTKRLFTDSIDLNVSLDTTSSLH